MKYKLAGCVILYNPEYDAIKNIESYINRCDIFYIVDNGNGKEIYNCLKAKYHNIKYIFNLDNKGISYSLNKVLKIVYKQNIDFLLTMDQDSYFDEDSLMNYLNAIRTLDWNKLLGVGPCVVEQGNILPPQEKSKNVQWKNTLRIITSGNIVNVNLAYQIGGWDENLFIDEVDHEFCYRGYIKNYKCLIALNNIYLNHSLGKIVLCKYLFKQIEVKNYHNYFRTYYMVRNRLYVYRKYHRINEFEFFKFYVVSVLKMLIFIIKKKRNKRKELKSYFLGIKDFLLNNMGKKDFDF